ncbi:MAG: hypothetical protein ABI113_20605 [Mucilaginibacter sp.]
MTSRKLTEELINGFLEIRKKLKIRMTRSPKKDQQEIEKNMSSIEKEVARLVAQRGETDV